MVTSAHDAEEALRPHLGRLHDLTETRRLAHVGPNVTDLERALGDALDKALELLGIQR